MLKRRKQIINPLVGFGQRPIGPYANRIGQSTYARNVALKGGLERPSDFLAFSATSQGVIKALVRGQWPVTFGRATGATVTDFEGLVKDCLENEIRFENARRVENLLSDSSVDLTQTAWNKGTNTTVTAFAGYSRLQMIDGASTFCYQQEPNTGLTYTASFFVRLGDSGSSANLLFDIVDGVVAVSGGLNITPTAEWVRYALTVDTSGFSNPPNFMFDGAAGAALDVDIKDCQWEDVTGQTNQNPSEYVSVGVATRGELVADDYSVDGEIGSWIPYGNNTVTNPGGDNVTITYVDNAAGAFLYLRAASGGALAEDLVLNKQYIVEFEAKCTGTVGYAFFEETPSAGGSLTGTWTTYRHVLSPLSITLFRLQFSLMGPGEEANIRNISLKEIDHGAFVDGVKYFAYLNGNEVDGSNVVTEAKGNDVGVDFVGTNHDLSDWTLLEGLTLGGSVTALDGTTLTNNGLIPTAEGSKYHGIAKNDIDMGADNVPIRFYFLAYEGTTKNWVALSILNRENLRCTQFWDVTSGAPAVGSQAGTLTGVASVVDLGSGWSMCILDVDSGSGSSQPTYEIYPADSDGDHQTSGDGSTPYVYIDFPRAMIGTEPWRALFEPTNTNLVEDSWDLTAASWAEAGTSVSALDAVGIGGRANTATTLTDDDGAAHEYVSDTYSITGDSPQSYIVWIRRDTDQTRFPTLRSVLSGGTGKSADIWLNTETGATQGAGDTANLEIDATAVGNFWVLTVTHTDTGTNTTGVLQIYPSRGTVFGTANVAATGSIEVAQVDWLDDTVHGFAVGTTPIPTSGGSDSRTADDATPMFDYSNWSQTEGTWYADVWCDPSQTSNVVIDLRDSAGNGVLRVDSSGRVASSDGVNTALANNAVLDSGRHRVITDFSTSDNELFSGGRDIDGSGTWVFSGTQPYDGDFTDTAQAINVAFNATAPIRFRDLKGYTTRKGKDWVEENE